MEQTKRSNQQIDVCNKICKFRGYGDGQRYVLRERERERGGGEREREREGGREGERKREREREREREIGEGGRDREHSINTINTRPFSLSKYHIPSLTTVPQRFRIPKTKREQYY